MDADIQINTSKQLKVTGEVDFANVARLRKLGCNFITKFEHPVFDLQEVVYVDNSGLALLIAWLRFAKQLDKSVCFINLPDQLKNIIELNGLGQIIPIK